MSFPSFLIKYGFTALPIYNPLLLLYIVYSYFYKLYITSTKRLVQIKYKIKYFLTAFRIILIFILFNRVYIRVYINYTGVVIEYIYTYI
jgi:hypothetical protein